VKSVLILTAAGMARFLLRHGISSEPTREARVSQCRRPLVLPSALVQCSPASQCNPWPTDDKKEVSAEAKGVSFDVQFLKEITKIRKQDQSRIVQSVEPLRPFSSLINSSKS
jgi:hypothetical protein